MDHKTLFVVLVSVFLVQAVALYQTWLQNKEEVGIRDWSIAAVLMSVGSIIVAFALYYYASLETQEERLSRNLLRVVGNAFGASGWFLLWVGIRHFYQRHAPGYRTIALFAVLFMALMAIENIVNVFPGWTSFCVSISFSVFAALSLYEFMRWNDRYNATVIMLCIMLLGTVVIWFTRALTHAGIEIPGVGMHGIYVLSLYNAIVASVTVTVSMIILTNERINGKLLALALKDPLTGAMNRRAFHESSRTILGNDSRDAGSNAVCLIDLDNFKMINDTYGHATGDRILARFSQLAMSILREGDLFSRYGGEEFVVLLMNCTIQDAEETMERLRRAWEQEEFAVEGRVVRNTISAGVVQVEEKTAFDLDKVLGYADTLLYRAKETGRNRVESAVYA